MKRLSLLIMLLSGVAAMPLSAAETWYEVEIIVVAQRTPDVGSEIWPSNPTPSAGLETALMIPASPQVQPTDPRIAALAPQDYRMQGEAQRIAANGNYELLLHTGWRQAGLSQEQSVALRVLAAETGRITEINEDTGIEPASSTTATVPHAIRLDGTLRLILSRYLHLEADIIYRAAETRKEDGFFTLFRSEQPEHPGYRLKEMRRMRSREMHYFDHPMFGIITLVTPYEIPAAMPTPTPALPAPAPATETTGIIMRN
jgi:hypothetical protein